MPTLKWSNVTGDDTNAGASSLKDAGSLFSKAFENFSGAVEGRKKRETKTNTEGVGNRIRNIGSREELEAAEAELGDFQGVKDQFGGNVDTTALSKALFDKRGYLDKQEANTLAKENAAESKRRADLTYNRGEEARARGIQNEETLRNFLTSTNTREATNAGAFGQVIAGQHESIDPLFSQDAGGNVITSPEASLEQRDAFAREAEGFGATQYQNVTEQIAEFNAKLPKGTTRGERTLMEQAIRNNYDQSNFSDKEQAANAANDTRVQSEGDLDVQRATDNFNLEKRSLNFQGPLSEAQIRDAKTKLSDKLLKQYNDGSMWPGAEGHTELVSIVEDLMTKYASQGIEPSMIEQFIAGSSIGDSGWLDRDRAVNVSDLQSKVANYMASGAPNAALVREQSLTAKHNTAVDLIRTNTRAKILKQKGLRERAKGAVNRGKNFSTFNPSARAQTKENEATIKKTARKEAVKVASKSPAVPKKNSAAADKILNSYKSDSDLTKAVNRFKTKLPAPVKTGYTGRSGEARKTLNDTLESLSSDLNKGVTLSRSELQYVLNADLSKRLQRRAITQLLKSGK